MSQQAGRRPAARDAGSADPPGRTERLEPELRKTMGILIVGVLAVLLDTTVVNVALNSLTRDLHASVAMIQWVTTSYLLALAMVVPISAWAAARFGARNVWIGSLLVFLVGSVLAGSAWNIESLIAFRVLQGASGGLLFPIEITIIVQAAGPARVGRVIALVGLPTVVVPILGPVVGGLILSSFSWRWVFLVNIPLCLVGLIMAWLGLPDSQREAGKRLDAIGLALLSPGLALILYGISVAGDGAGPAAASVLGPLIAGLLLTAVFTVYALRRGSRAIIDPRLFRIPSYSASCALIFILGLALYGGLLLLPLYYQQGEGRSALAAGLLLSPQGFGSLIARGPIGGWIDKFGARPVTLGGLALAALGTAAYTQVASHPPVALLAASLVIRGAGLVAAQTAVMANAYKGLAPEQVPHASSTTRIVQQVGGSFGAAIIAVLLQWQLGRHAQTAAGVNEAYGVAFWWALGLTAAAFIPALFLPGTTAKQGALTSGSAS